MSRFWVVFSLLCIKSGCCLYRDELPAKSNSTLIVGILFLVDDVNSIRLMDMDYRLDYYVVYNWTIPKDVCRENIRKLVSKDLIHEATAAPSRDLYIMTGDELKHFWLPDTYIPDTKKVELTTLPGRNEMLTMRVKQDDCHFSYEIRLAAIVGCQMDFRAYPYDVQVCEVRLRSHFYTLSLLKYEWTYPGVKFGPHKEVRLNHYKMTIQWDSYNETAFNGGMYSWLRIKLTFQRQLSHFLVQVVVPTVLIVAVAYSSFWIGVDSGPGRFLLTVLVLLSLVTQFAGLKGQLPPVSYINGLDIWMLICMLFVFSAIIELALVNFLDKRRRRKEAKEKAKEEEDKRFKESLKQDNEGSNPGPNGEYVNFALRSMQTIPTFDLEEPNRRRWGKFRPNESNNNVLPHTVYPVSGINNNLTTRPHVTDQALLVDKIFRVLYPVAFAIFNCIFWPLLLSRNLL